MPSLFTKLPAIALTFLMEACTAVPPLPNDQDLPVRHIILATTCELREAFEDLNDPILYPGFKADQWAMSISLTPKVDTEAAANLGLSGKTSVKTVNVWSWTTGTPGAQYDKKGHSDAQAEYPIHSSQLLDVKNYPLNCEASGDPVLSHQLGAYDWLHRMVVADGSGLNKLSMPDKAAFTTEVIIKYDITNVGFTYAFTYRNVGPNFSGSQATDDTLTIAFTPDPKKVKVNTLPEGTPIVKSKVYNPAPNISPGAANRLDQIQTDVRIGNIRLNSTN